MGRYTPEERDHSANTNRDIECLKKAFQEAGIAEYKVIGLHHKERADTTAGIPAIVFSSPAQAEGFALQANRESVLLHQKQNGSIEDQEPFWRSEGRYVIPDLAQHRPGNEKTAIDLAGPVVSAIKKANPETLKQWFKAHGEQHLHT